MTRILRPRLHDIERLRDYAGGDQRDQHYDEPASDPAPWQRLFQRVRERRSRRDVESRSVDAHAASVLVEQRDMQVGVAIGGEVEGDDAVAQADDAMRIAQGERRLVQHAQHRQSALDRRAAATSA